MEFNLATYAVRNTETGNVDAAATVAKFSADLDNYIVQRETEESTIGESVNAVFDALQEAGTRANLPYVVNQALTLMNISAMPSAYKTMYDRVHKFIQDNSQGKTDKATGQVERPTSLFVISRGRSAIGSLSRRSDLPVQDEE